MRPQIIKKTISEIKRKSEEHRQEAEKKFNEFKKTVRFAVDKDTWMKKNGYKR